MRLHSVGAVNLHITAATVLFPWRRVIAAPLVLLPKNANTPRFKQVRAKHFRCLYFRVDPQCLRSVRPAARLPVCFTNLSFLLIYLFIYLFSFLTRCVLCSRRTPYSSYPSLGVDPADCINMKRRCIIDETLGKR